MNYAKPPLTLDQQVALLAGRGMAGDPALMKARLATVNYYRLSGYWYTFRNSDDTFAPNTSFEQVWSRYVFDRRFRLVVMDAVERIEVAVRSLLAYHHAHLYGAFAYAESPASLPKLTLEDHTKFVERIREESDRSKEPFAKHFRKKYGDSHNHLPVWMVTEVMTFGTMLTFYRGASRRVKQAVASEFGMPDRVFDSWLLTLSAVRNICAHHGRLWNRESGVKPWIPREDDYPQWHRPVRIENDRIFAILTICRHCLTRIAPQSRWQERLEGLFAEFPAIAAADMGFPENWKESPIWGGFIKASANGDSEGGQP